MPPCEAERISSVTLHNIVNETTNLDQDAISFFEKHENSAKDVDSVFDISVSSDEEDNSLIITTWSDADRLSYKTKNNWCLDDRKPKKGEKPSGRVVKLEVVDKTIYRLGLRPSNIVVYNGHEYQTPYQIPVYHESQTRPAKIAQRTKDYIRFKKLLNLTYGKHIHHTDDGWRHDRCESLFEDDYWRQDYMSLDKIKAHVNCRDVYGGFAEESELMWMDLDFHACRSMEAFLDGLKVILGNWFDLLKILGGRQTFHQISDGDANGIHTGCRLPRRRPTEETEQIVQDWLGRLAQQHPEVHQRWVNCGLRDWQKTEVYPNSHNGCRLLMCRGRTMLTDRPLPLLQGGRYDGMHDIVSLMKYLDGEGDPMPVDAVLSYLADRLREPVCLASTDGDIIPIDSGRKQQSGRSTTKSSRTSQEKKIIWKNRTRPNLIRFWSGQWNPGGSLNEVIGVHSRLAPYYLPDAKDIAQERLEQFVEELPDEARDCSGRLADGHGLEVYKVITRCLDKAYAGNKNQKDSAISVAKLEESVGHWQKVGFDPFDKSTWLSEESPVRFTVDWTEDDIQNFQRLKQHFGRAKDIDPVVLVERCLELVLMKRKEGNGIALNYWKVFFTERFGLACGDTGNRRHQRIVQELQDLGVIEVSKKPIWSGGHRATMYDFGERIAERKGWETGLTDEERLERIIAA